MTRTRRSHKQISTQTNNLVLFLRNLKELCWYMIKDHKRYTRVMIFLYFIRHLSSLILSYSFNIMIFCVMTRLTQLWNIQFKLKDLEPFTSIRNCLNTTFPHLLSYFGFCHQFYCKTSKLKSLCKTFMKNITSKFYSILKMQYLLVLIFWISILYHLKNRQFIRRL